jgi:hypothetical protein
VGVESRCIFSDSHVYLRGFTVWASHSRLSRRQAQIIMSVGISTRASSVTHRKLFFCLLVLNAFNACSELSVG